MNTLVIAPLQPADLSDWLPLAQAYKAFYNTPTSEAEYQQAWARLLAGQGLHGLGARVQGQLVGITPAEGVADRAATQQPHDVRARSLLGQLGEGDQSGERGVTAARNGDPLPRVPGAHPRIGEVGDLVGDPVTGSALARSG